MSERLVLDVYFDLLTTEGYDCYRLGAGNVYVDGRRQCQLTTDYFIVNPPEGPRMEALVEIQDGLLHVRPWLYRRPEVFVQLGDPDAVSLVLASVREIHSHESIPKRGANRGS